MTDILATKRRVLAEQLDLCGRAAAALMHTWRKLDPELIGESDPDLLEALEALTARFARLEDILLKRVFRAVAAVELSDAERLLDVLDLMERLHLIEGTEQWVELKELRNAIVHEYELDDLPALQRQVYQAVPKLLDALEAVSSYAANQLAAVRPSGESGGD